MAHSNFLFAVYYFINKSVVYSAQHAYAKSYAKDWIRFFQGEWARAVFHDKFGKLMSALRNILKTDKFMIVVLGRVLEKAEMTMDNQVVADFRKEITGVHGELISDTSLNLIQAETNEFLRLFKLELPGFLS